MGKSIFSPYFIFAGNVGGWKDYFTKEQEKELDEKFKATFDGTDVHFEYQ